MERQANTEKVIAIKTPAKVNLMLAVQGPREDGFHALTSLVAPLAFGDELRLQSSNKDADQFICEDPAVPKDDRNLILQAANAFRKRTGEAVYFQFELEKRIPIGAGLGGGSSNAAGALMGMNTLTGQALSQAAIYEIAAELGSDCPFFIKPRIALMSGRGEILRDAPQALEASLRGQKILLFKPHFEINTGLAYAALRAASPEYYVTEGVAESFLKVDTEANGFGPLVFNSFEAAVGRKYRAIHCLLAELRQRGVICGLSGSGSCCFAFIETEAMQPNSKDLKGIIQSAWGESVFFVETTLI